MSQDQASKLFALAQTAFRAGRLQESLERIDALVRLAPRHAEAWNLAGVVCHVRRDFDAAVRYFQRALALGGGAGVLVNLGFALHKLGRDEQAEQAYREAARRAPGLALAWQKLGALQELRGRREEALASFRQAVALDPGDLRSLGDGLLLRRHLGDWSNDAVLDAERLLVELSTAKRSDLSTLLLLAIPEATPAQQRAAASLFARTQWGQALAAPPLAPTPRAHAGRLRIGYLSADFCEHAVAYLVTEVLAAHDRQVVEVFAYGYRAPQAQDPWRQAIEAAVEHFIDLDTLDDHDAAARIHADQIDVLVDLTGYTGQARPGITAQRPAPVIAQWLGYIGTLGEARLADYVIGDAVATPLAQAQQFSEAPALLPRCFQPNGRLFPLPAAPTRESENLPAAAVVFCSFNQPFKFNAPLWDDWCAILRGVAGSVLWLAPPRDALAATNLRREAAARGVSPERIVMAQQRPRNEHLARLPLADIALDTYPYNSGTTASDALRAGVPLLSWLGPNFVGRMAGSLLHAASLPECVLPDRAALVAKAIALGNDGEARTALRHKLQQALPRCGLFEPDGFARDLERLFATMHAQCLAGLREPILLT